MQNTGNINSNEFNTLLTSINILIEKVDSLTQNNSSSKDVYLTRKEALSFLRVGSTTFNKLRQQGKVTPIREGGKTLYVKSELIEYRNSIRPHSFQ
mgnify:CR=1 FL=1